ncbi:MAG: cytochrome P450 [Polyangiaceae bacterium]|nr:cytochrome P450 [Polyangiaceae bacterium]
MNAGSYIDKNRVLRFAQWHARASGKAPAPPSNALGHLGQMQNDQLGFFLRAREQCGDVARFRFILLPVHLLAHPEHVRRVLVDEHRNYDKQTKGFNVLRLVLGNGLLTAEGELWRRQRRIAQPAFHRERIAAFGERMVLAAEDTVRSWIPIAERSGTIDIASEMMRLTLRIAGETLLSTDVTGDAASVGQAVSLLLTEANVRILHPIEVPLNIPTPHNRRVLSALSTLESVVRKMIEERRKMTGQRPNDLLTMLMEARDEETGESMTDQQLRDEVLTIFLAGHETTANALAWTFYLLSLHPGVARRVEKEIVDVLGNRLPEVGDVNKLVYTTAVLKESMRLYPPAWIIGRRAVNDDVVDGYEIPADSIVFASPWVTHRHPGFWQNPEGFDPDRFLPERAATIHRTAYFPFGAGPRICIGQGFAMIEAVLLLATLCRKFRIDLVPGHPVVPQPSITLRPRYGIKARPILHT